MLTTLEDYYPKAYQNEVIWYEESYINLQLSYKDVIYRNELLNYHLSDDRSYTITIALSQLYSKLKKHHDFHLSFLFLQDIVFPHQ